MEKLLRNLSCSQQNTVCVCEFSPLPPRAGAVGLLHRTPLPPPILCMAQHGSERFCSQHCGSQIRQGGHGRPAMHCKLQAESPAARSRDARTELQLQDVSAPVAMTRRAPLMRSLLLLCYWGNLL